MNIAERIESQIKSQFEEDSSGHDWYHIQRVLELSRYIQKKEGGDLEVIVLAALLHDISDHKFNGGKLDEGGKISHALLMRNGADKQLADKVSYIVDNISYKGADTDVEMNSLEGKIVQDADRLDAIGAIGVARTFAYGGHIGQPMYNPKLAPTIHKTFEEYTKSETSTINHFYEKLLLLADRLNTATAREIGKERHDFLENYLSTFLNEWNFNSSENG